MKVLCLTDFPVNPPDRWIWNYLDGAKDQTNFPALTLAVDAFGQGDTMLVWARKV